MMKYIRTLLIMFCLYPFFGNAQTFDKPRGGFYIYPFGMKTVEYSKIDLDVRAIDKSEVPDTFSINKKWDKNTYNYDIVLGFTANVYHDWFMKFQMGWGFKQINQFYMDLGLGYNLYYKRWWFQPGVDFGFSSTYKNIGTMQNSDLYIGFGEKQFTGKDVKVNISKTDFNVKPTLGIHYRITKNIALSGDIGYNFGVASNSRISFSGEDIDKQPINHRERLNLNGVSTKNNGMEISKLPFNGTGLFWHFGVNFVFSRHRKSVSLPNAAPPTTTPTPNVTPTIRENKINKTNEIPESRPKREPLKEIPKEKPKEEPKGY